MGHLGTDPARHLDDAVVRAGDARSVSAGDDQNHRTDAEGPAGCCGLLWAAVGCCGLLWVTEIMAGQLVMLAVDPRKTYDLCQEWLALHPLPELEGWTEDAESFFS